MKLICGLGNPGKEYEMTRHNVGFMIVDNYCNRDKFSSKFGGLYVEKIIEGEKVIFLKPQSFMNLSGNVVRPFCDYYKIDHKDILVIRDDLDIEIGRARVKFDSTSGGDNGVKSIISNLGEKDFYQYKVGISNDKTRDTKDYVLGRFSKQEMELLNRVIDDSKNVIEDFIGGRITGTKDYTYGE